MTPTHDLESAARLAFRAQADLPAIPSLAAIIGGFLLAGVFIGFTAGATLVGLMTIAQNLGVPALPALLGALAWTGGAAWWLGYLMRGR